MYRLLKDVNGTTREDMVQRVIDGAFVPNNEENSDWVVYRDWLAAGNTPDPADPLPPPPRTLTPREFRERFTDAEQGVINAAALTDSQVFGWRIRATEVSQIDLNSPETARGVDFLIFKSLVAAERKAELLA